MNKIFSVLAAVLFCCGCVSVEYSGSTAEPRAENAPPIAVYRNKKEITRQYKVLGIATASGNYREVGSDRLIKALKEKAEKCGADAIVITDEKVTADQAQAVNSPSFTTAWDNDEVESNWQIINQDTDLGFVNNYRDSGTTTTSGSTNNFTRTISAEFLRY